jgi:hypothetical protein
MLSIKKWMELADHKITECSDYGWACYGPNAYQLSSWNGIHGAGGYSFNIVFDTRTQEVYEVDACDYSRDRAYRLIAKDHRENHRREAEAHRHLSIGLNTAWDGVDFVDLESAKDFLRKARAIKSGEDYDTRVDILVDFSDRELLQYMKVAHNRDITFNQLVEQALGWFIDEVKSGRITKEQAQNFIKEHKNV